MSTLAAALRSEIEAAVGRHAREQAQALRRAVAAQREEIDQLERRVAALERQRADVGDAGVRRRGNTAPPKPQLRFSAKGLVTLRQRLGLSAAALGALVGVTAQSVYKWEDGKARPRASQLQAIAALRGLSKREAAARLAEVSTPERRQA